MATHKDIPELLKKKRTALGLSMKAAAGVIGISQMTISRLEKGDIYKSNTMEKVLLWLKSG